MTGTAQDRAADGCVMIHDCETCSDVVPVSGGKCAQCGAEPMTPRPAVTWLECPDCGGVAVESETGIFREGDAENCSTCNSPGHIVVEDSETVHFRTEES